MSTLANITSLNLSLQTGGAALAVKAVKSVAKPERVVYVFGTADDVAPNFTTIDGALTYANSLTPLVTEPVVIRLFTKADGTPYDLLSDGFDEWTVFATEYIYFYSDFKRQNITYTLPTTLPAGQQVWYIDPNGVETLWVGREDGSAWPAVGYKRLVVRITNPTDASFSVLYSDFASFTLEKQSGQGRYYISGNAELSGQNNTIVNFPFNTFSGGVQHASISPVGGGPSANVWQIVTSLDSTLTDIQATAHIIVYP
jgi:hypothetical protein